MSSNLSVYIRKYRFKSIYARMFILFSILLACVISAVGSFSYFTASGSIQEKVNESELNSLQQSQEVIDGILAEADLITINLASHYLLQQDFDEYSLSQKIDATEALFGSIKKDDYLNSIYIYYSKSEKILTSENIVSNASSYSDMEWLDAYMKNAPLGFKPLYLGNRINKTVLPGTQVLTIVREFPLNSMPKKGVILINLDKKKLFDYIDHLSAGDKGLLVIDSTGSLLFGESKYMEQLKQLNIYDSIVKDQTGFHKARLDHTNMMISSVHSKRSKWMYIKLQDRDYMTADADMIKRITTILALTCLLVGVLAYMLIFVNFFRPVTKLLNKTLNLTGEATVNNPPSRNEFDFLHKAVDTVIANNRAMKEVYNNSLNEIKKGLLMNFCSGDIHDREYIIKQLNVVGFDVEDNELTIILIKLNSLKKLADKYSTSDISQLKEELRNIVDSYDQINFKTLSGYMENDKLMCLVSYKGNENYIISCATTLKERIMELLNLDITIGIGSSSRDIFAMYVSYQEALDALSYKVLSGEDEVIHINNFDVLGKSPKYYYPIEKEKALIEALKLGDSQQAVKTVKEISSTIPTSPEAASYIPEMLWQLMNGLFRSVNSMGIKYEDIFGKSFFDSYQEFRSNSKIEDMLHFIEDHVTRLTGFINNRRSCINDKVIDNIKIYIQENYKQNISLNSVASRVYMNPAYISTIFKELTGENFTEYLMKVRIEKGMELLINTQKNIEVISAEVGYESRSFMRAFKKYAGMTPTDYRRKMGIEALNQESENRKND